MENWKVLLIFIGLFIIIFIIDYFFINKKKLYLIENNGKTKKGKKKEVKTISEIEYLTWKCNLNPKKIDKKKAIIWISIINSFIISLVSSIVMLIPMKFVFQILIAFVSLFALIYSLYEIYGRHLKKLENKPSKESK